VKKRFRRQHFRADGVAKTPYTESEARSAGAFTGKDAYHCGHCGQWHIGGWAPKNSEKKAAASLQRPAA